MKAPPPWPIKSAVAFARMLVVDAYNVLHVTGVLPQRLAGLGVADLIRLIARSRYARRKLTVVCDGGGGTRSSGAKLGHARVLFSGDHEEADDLIERLIDRFAHGGGLSVISSDKRLRKAARRRRAESIPSDAFLAQLVEDESRPAVPGEPAFTTEVPLDAYSVAHWLAEFGLEAPDPATKPREVRSAEPAPGRKKVPPPGPQGAGVFGESLTIELPEPPTPRERAAAPESHEAPPAVPENATDPASEDGAGLEVDPLLRRALEEWRGLMSLDDLDMRRWIDGVQPLRVSRRSH